MLVKGIEPKKLLILSIRAVDPDPHSFSLLDPGPHSICRSEFRREKFVRKNLKNGRNFVEIAIKFFKT